MAVYGRIEEVSETIQSNEIENRLDRNLESHVEKEEQVAFPFFRLIIGSTIATIFSVVLPLLLDMVSPSQAQDLYIGWALHQGGQLYSSYYAGQGLLYYLLLYITQGGILFALVEWLALLGGGYFLFSATDYLTGQRDQAKQLLTIFYILVSGLGFGGGYATILAMPFLFAGFSLVARYLSNPNNDKGFLRLGILLALSFFIEPHTSLLFTVVVTIGLFVFNVGHGRFAHGIYQFFTTALGFSLLFYPVGYYVIISGGFGEALGSLLYPIDSLQIFNNPQLIDHLLFYGLLTFGLGALVLIFLGLFQSKASRLYVISVPASFVFLFALVLLIFSQEPLHGSRLILILPFLLLLLMTSIRGKHSARGARRRRREEVPTLWKKFMRGNLYLPILVVVYLIAIPFVARFVLHPASYSEQHQVVDRIKQETSEGDQIYIWDSYVQIYKESQRLPGSMFPSPLLYTNTEENKTSLINDLKENQPKLIVVNDKVALWSEAETLLKENYQQVKTDYSEFKLYKLK